MRNIIVTVSIILSLGLAALDPGIIFAKSEFSEAIVDSLFDQLKTAPVGRAEELQNQIRVYQIEDVNHPDPAAVEHIQTALSLINQFSGAGKFTLAHKIVSKMLQVVPDYAFGHLTHGGLLILQERFEEAEQPLLKTLSLEPRSLDAMYLLLGLYIKQERFSNAQAMIKRIHRLSPNFTYNGLGLDSVQAKLDGFIRKISI